MHARFFSPSTTLQSVKYFRASVQFTLSVSLGIAAGLGVGALEKASDTNALWDWHWITASDVTTAVVSVAASQFLQYVFDRCCPIDPQSELEAQPLQRFSRTNVN